MDVHCIFCNKSLGKLDCTHECINCIPCWDVEYNHAVSCDYTEIIDRSIRLFNVRHIDETDKWRYVTLSDQSFLPGPPRVKLYDTTFIVPGSVNGEGYTLAFEGLKMVTPSNADEWHDRLALKSYNFIECYICKKPCRREYAHYPNDPKDMGWENWKCKNHKVEVNNIYDIQFSDEVTVSKRTLSRVTFFIRQMHYIDINDDMTPEKLKNKIDTYILFS